MLNNFIYAETKELFLDALNNNKVLDEAIVFIADTGEIWNHGTYFAGGDIDSNVLAEIAQLRDGKISRDEVEGKYLLLTDFDNWHGEFLTKDDEKTYASATDLNSLKGSFDEHLAQNSVTLSEDGNTLTVTINDTTGSLTNTDTVYTAGNNINIDENNEISAIDTTYTAGSGLTLTDGEFRHQNIIAESSLESLVKVAYDSTGHITKSTPVSKTDITDLGIADENTWRPIKCNNASIENSELHLKSGSNITFERVNGEIIISSLDTNTTYTAGDHIAIVNDTISATWPTLTDLDGASSDDLNDTIDRVDTLEGYFEGGVAKSAKTAENADNADNANTVNGYHFAVVTALPDSPDENTIYFIKG